MPRANPSFGVARFTGDGRLDRSFGVGGTVQLQLGSGSYPLSSVAGLALEPGGGVVVAGPTSPGFGVARFDSSGKLMWSVVHQIDFSGGPVVRQPDGKLVIGGSFAVSASDGSVSRSDAAVARVDEADGSLDTSFAGKGYVAEPVPLESNGCLDSGPSISAIALTASRSIVVGGAELYHCGVGGRARTPIFRAYTPAGERDTTFATGALGLRSVDRFIVLPDQSAVALGAIEPGGFGIPAFARYTSTGSLDPSFAPPLGVTYAPRYKNTGPPGDPFGFAVQSDGRLVGGALQYGNSGKNTSRLFRTFSNGRPDPSFGRDGVVKVSIETAEAMAMQPDGRIVVAGVPGSNNYGDNRVVLTRLVGGMAPGRVTIAPTAQVRSHTARIAVRCGPLGATRCSGVLRTVFAQAHFELSAGAHTTIKVRLDRSTIRKLEQKHRVQIWATASNGRAKPTKQRVRLIDQRRG